MVYENGIERGESMKMKCGSVREVGTLEERGCELPEWNAAQQIARFVSVDI
jgi:hypothetical protein